MRQHHLHTFLSFAASVGPAVLAVRVPAVRVCRTLCVCVASCACSCRCACVAVRNLFFPVACLRQESMLRLCLADQSQPTQRASATFDETEALAQWERVSPAMRVLSFVICRVEVLRKKRS